MSESANNIVYKDLSYKIMGILFKVHNKLGPSYQEKYYQRAIEKELKVQNILGLLVNFNNERLYCKRIINPKIKFAD